MHNSEMTTNSDRRQTSEEEQKESISITDSNGQHQQKLGDQLQKLVQVSTMASPAAVHIASSWAESSAPPTPSTISLSRQHSLYQHPAFKQIKSKRSNTSATVWNKRWCCRWLRHCCAGSRRRSSTVLTVLDSNNQNSLANVSPTLASKQIQLRLRSVETNNNCKQVFDLNHLTKVDQDGRQNGRPDDQSLSTDQVLKTFSNEPARRPALHKLSSRSSLYSAKRADFSGNSSIRVSMAEETSGSAHAARCVSGATLSGAGGAGGGTASSGHTKALYTTLIILGTYLICWMPALFFQVLTCVDGCPYPLFTLSIRKRVILSFINNSLVIIKSMVDPFIYIYRMKEVKLALRRSGYWLCGEGRRRTMANAHRANLYGATGLNGRKLGVSQTQASSRSHACVSYTPVRGDDSMVAIADPTPTKATSLAFNTDVNAPNNGSGSNGQPTSKPGAKVIIVVNNFF